MLTSLVWSRLEKKKKRSTGMERRSPAFEADALTTRPTRRKPRKKQTMLPDGRLSNLSECARSVALRVFSAGDESFERKEERVKGGENLKRRKEMYKPSLARERFRRA